MAAVRRGQGSLNLDLAANQSSNELPTISALFLIYFDIKAGYTVGWKRSLPGIELEGVVEYKSLPSGLHTVKEDLIYFVHDNYAGVSAFVNAPAAEESRNARMIAVGVLVPLSYGRLGRAWKHAEKLKQMASGLIVDTSYTHILEEFWEAHYSCGPSQDSDSNFLVNSPSTLKYIPTKSTSAQPQSHGRNRSVSDGTTLELAGQSLSGYHPVWSLARLVEAFGPLIFPIYRAALLRRRILITAYAPIEETCNFVYDLSLLSNIPHAVSDRLSHNAPPQRLRPLFSIGVHDIPLLEEELRASKSAARNPSSENQNSRDKLGHGWIACTTDSILATKSTLYDVLITMPTPYSDQATERVWPKVQSPKGTEVKATQRDLSRYRTLLSWLSRDVSDPSSPASARRTSTGSLENLPRKTSLSSLHRENPMLDIPDTDSIIEPLSWSALAYSGFMWWASAGEQRLNSKVESESESALLPSLSVSPSPQTPQNLELSSASLTKNEDEAKLEFGIITYFHRLTTLTLTTLSDIVDATDSDDEREDATLMDHSEEDESGPVVYVSSADVARMGLDVWSEADHQFIECVARDYFGRQARVEGRRVDVCGIRIC